MVTLDSKAQEFLDTVERLSNYVVAGQAPKITFQFPPELTKTVTLTLYKWISLSGFYLLYKDILGAKEGDDPETMRNERTKKEAIRKYYLIANIVNSYYKDSMSRSFLMKIIRIH
jgi:hypothetical protein